MSAGRSQLVLHRAGNAWQRLCGLLGRPPLAPGQGLWLVPCRAVHTAGMRYCIDVAFVDGGGRVVRIVHGLRPWRCAFCWRARSVVELAAGEAAAARGGAARIEAAVRDVAGRGVGQSRPGPGPPRRTAQAGRGFSAPAENPPRRARTR